MATFVLVHGAWHGGWCYKRVAARLLRHPRMNVATSSKEPTMTQRIPENFSAAEWRLVTIMGNTMPPRDPNDDDDDDEDEDNDTEPDDEPPVVREPDEDE